MYETVFNGIKTLERHRNATFNMFFNIKKIVVTKKFIYRIVFISNQNFTIFEVKIVLNSRFFFNFLKFKAFSPKLPNSRFFHVKWKPCIFMQIKTGDSNI